MLWIYESGLILAGTLEVMPMELLQEIMTFTGHVAFNLKWLLHLPYASLVSSHLNCHQSWVGDSNYIRMAAWTAVYTAARTTPMEKKHLQCPASNLWFLSIFFWVEECRVWPRMVFWAWSWAEVLLSTAPAQSHTLGTWQGQNLNLGVCLQSKYVSLIAGPWTFSPEITVFWLKALGNFSITC